MTVTTLTTPAPAIQACIGDYGDYLAMLEHVQDREVAAQTLDTMTALAESIARGIRDDGPEPPVLPGCGPGERDTALAALAGSGWQQEALGWAETATYLWLLSCAMRGAIPSCAEDDDNWGWARDRWADLALAATHAEVAAGWTALENELGELTSNPAPEDSQALEWEDGYVHPFALAQLTAAVNAIIAAPWPQRHAG